MSVYIFRVIMYGDAALARGESSGRKRMPKRIKASLALPDELQPQCSR